jgi:hypothetical protein
MADYDNSHLNEVVFKRRVKDALRDVDRILELGRNPRLAEDVDHAYSDKYALASTLTNTTIVAQMNVLDRGFGLTKEVLQKLDASDKPTTLRFQAWDACKFVKEQSVDVKPSKVTKTTEDTQTTGTFFGSTKKSTVTEMVKRVREFHWTVESKWELSVYSGTDTDNRIVLKSRTATLNLITQNKNPPLPEKREHKPVEMPLTWLLKQIDLNKSSVHFTIDTEDKDCKTPRRNEQVKTALEFFNDTSTWVQQIIDNFGFRYRSEIVRQHNPANPAPSNAIEDKTSTLLQSIPKVFVPVIALMEDLEAGTDVDRQDTPLTTQVPSKSVLSLQALSDNGPTKSKILPAQDTARLLNEQVKTLEDALQFLQSTFSGEAPHELISLSEATLFVLSNHSQNIFQQFLDSIQYIEQMLENQLVAAIGKRVTSSDLDQYVRYHNSRMLNPAPLPFCQAIRRPDRYPDGIFSIESDMAPDGKIEPIETHVREVQGMPPLQLPLNAATTLELTGKTFLHGWLNHRFETKHTSFTLTGRARQFSSFMLVIGTMAGPNKLQPKDAIILQNKDEVKIPLLLSEIPTAKEFKDAIESLSPEQQRFAKAYRSMQLDSSVLGVCVIQIKPQLEKLLGLPHDSLTKEMKLTQDLMELFVEYQVPSDMLSYDGENEESTTKEKVDNVRSNVKSVMDVIEKSKKKQLKDKEMEADMAFESKYVEDPIPIMEAMAMEDSFESDFAPKRRKGGPRRASSRDQKERLYSTARSTPLATSQFAAACMAMPPAPAYSVTAKQSGSPFGASASVNSAIESPTSPQGGSGGAAETVSIVQPSNDIGDKFSGDDAGKGTSSSENAIDFTRIPKTLDAVIEKFDEDCALRSTTIKTSENWTRQRQENLLTKAKTTTLSSEERKTEKDKAFDLLDALSRSGSLQIPFSELHVIVCVTHCFEKNVMETVIQDSINPVEKLEMSTLLVASTIHGVSAKNLISNGSDRARLSSCFPALIEAQQAEH